MKVVRFMGGLGNQFFQYVFLRRLELLYGVKVKADFSYYKTNSDTIRQPRILNFNVRLNMISDEELAIILHLDLRKEGKYVRYKLIRLLEKLTKRGYYFHKGNEYIDPKRILSYTYYNGYWQSHNYLVGMEDQIKNELKLKKPLSFKAQDWVNNVKKENTVFVGIRLGDYLSEENAKIFGFFDSSYYLKGIEIVKANVSNPTFIVFSDDPKMAKEKFSTLSSVKNLFFFDDEVSVEEELIIRANCKHAIISNSTYNWWGAWLIPGNDKMVIAPKQWFADGRKIDIVPPDWITI